MTETECREAFRDRVMRVLVNEYGQRNMDVKDDLVMVFMGSTAVIIRFEEDFIVLSIPLVIDGKLYTILKDELLDQMPIFATMSLFQPAMFTRDCTSYTLHHTFFMFERDFHTDETLITIVESLAAMASYTANMFYASIDPSYPDMCGGGAGRPADDSKDV